MLLFLQKLDLSLQRHQCHDACLFLLLHLHLQRLDLTLLLLYDFLIFVLHRGELLAHLIFFVLDQGLVLQFKLELVLLGLFLELLLDLFNHDFLRLHDLFDSVLGRLCSLLLLGEGFSRSLQLLLENCHFLASFLFLAHFLLLD